MTSMRAVFLTGHGGNEVVAIDRLPLPEPRPGTALVRIRGAGLNRVDLYMRDSGAGITHRLPLVMGLDGAGEVAEIAPGETRLKLGQKVVIHPGLFCGRCEFCARGETVLCTSMQLMGEHVDGTLRDYARVPVANLFPMPDGFDFVEAAALGTAPITAWRMVFTKARVAAQDTVLIFGIGGSVSLSALQLVKMVGARAIVTSRDPDKRARALALGADAAIDSGADIPAQVMALTGGRGVDVVIENVGEAVWPAALRALVRGGRIVTCGATSGDQPSADLRRMFIRQLQVLGSTHGTPGEFNDLLTVCRRGAFRPQIDRRFAFADLHAALDRLAAGTQFGKIGIEMPAD